MIKRQKRTTTMKKINKQEKQKEKLINRCTLNITIIIVVVVIIIIIIPPFSLFF